MNISKKFKSIACIAVIAISIIAIIILVADYSKNRKTNSDLITDKSPTVTLKTKEDKVLVSVSTETIQDGLSNMGFLVTQEYYFTQVEKYTKEKEMIFGITSSSEFMYSYDGSVFAGIDFEKITVKKDDSKKTITVNLPESEIQTVNVDKDTFKIYSEKDSLWNPLNLEDYNLSLAEFEKTAKQKALDSGILDRSNEQAKTLVLNFVKNFPAASDYEIVFE